MINRLFKIVKCFGMEMNVGKPKVMRIPMQTSHVQIMVDQKQPENMEYFSYLCSMVTNNARCTCEIKSTKRKLFSPANWTSIYIRKELVKRYIWIIALFGAETWTLRIVDPNYLERFGMCFRRRM
jgi:hypothetical protein